MKQRNRNNVPPLWVDVMGDRRCKHPPPRDQLVLLNVSSFTREPAQIMRGKLTNIGYVTERGRIIKGTITQWRPIDAPPPAPALLLLDDSASRAA